MAMTPEQGVEADELVGKGRSPWSDARRRFFRNKAALVGLAILGFVVVFALFGNFFAQWSNEELDYNVMGQIAELGGPSFASGHYFGTDDLGRDLFARTVQGTQISLAVGLVGALIACLIGTLYGAIAGYVGGRTDNIMMRLVDIFMAVPYMFVLILLLVMVAPAFQQMILSNRMVSEVYTLRATLNAARSEAPDAIAMAGESAAT